MKSIAILAAACLSTGAMAQTYMGVAGGLGNTEQDCTGSLTCKSNGSAMRVYGGMMLKRDVGLELGHTSFGKATTTWDYTYVDPYTGGSATVDKMEAKTDATYVALALQGPIGKERTSLAVMRLGLASVKTAFTSWGTVSYTVTSPYTTKDSYTKIKPYFGLGVAMPLASNVFLTVDGDFTQGYDGYESYSVRAFTLGLRAYF